MPKQTTLSAYQAAQRGPTHVGMSEIEAAAEQPSNGHAAASIDPLTGRLVDADPFDLAVPHPDGESAPLTVADQLAALRMDSVTEATPLFEVIARVRTLALDMGATEEEIRAEGERRWASLGNGRTISADERTAPTTADHLIGLQIEAQCTAEMSLHMITERVRQAIHAAGATIDEPTDADIVAEAERIWTSFTDNRTGPREYTAGPDGVRATITNNQTGETVTLEEAQIAAQTPAASQPAPKTSRTPTEPSGAKHVLRVPAESEFGADEEFFVSSSLKVRADVLRDRHPDLFEHLDRLAVVYLWKKAGGKAKGLAVYGKTTKPTGKLKFFSSATFVIELSADHCRGAYYGDPEIEQLLFHEMLHTGESEADEETGRGGGPSMIPHQLEIFHAEIEVYGMEAVILRDAAPLFRAAVQAAAPQMSLFSEDDAEGEDAVHREARLAGIVLTDSDQAADPDSEYPDDALADPAVI